MRRSRTDTLPLVAPSATPRLVTVGLTEDETRDLGAITGATETISLARGAGLASVVAGHEPDLLFVVIDPQHSQADTLPLVRELKLLPETHFIPIMAAGSDDTRMPAYAAGVDHWLPLPFPVEELRVRSRALLHSAALSRALRQSRQELRLRRDWVRYLVHDLRNLLTKAIGDLAMATRKAAADPSAAGELMARCEDELWRCSALLNDLIDVDRIRKGALNLRRAPTDLVALTQSTAATFHAAARRRRVELLVLSTSPSLSARVDAALIERVVANLVSNALRYAPEDSPIRIGISASGGRAAIEIANQGPSIPPEVAAEIFEPFVAGDDGQAAGTGLGLAFCRLTVELHGGAITVSEPVGGGASFRVELPA